MKHCAKKAEYAHEKAEICTWESTTWAVWFRNDLKDKWLHKSSLLNGNRKMREYEIQWLLCFYFFISRNFFDWVFYKSYSSEMSFCLDPNPLVFLYKGSFKKVRENNEDNLYSSESTCGSPNSGHYSLHLLIIKSAI